MRIHMKRFVIYLALLSALVAIFLSTYFFKESYELLPMNTKLETKTLPPNQSWFPYDAPGGEFTVSLPLLPQTATQDLTDPKNGEVRHYEMYIAQTAEGTIYMISLITLSKLLDESEKTEMLNQLMNDMVSANKGNKLRNSKSGVYEGMNSIDFTIDKESGHVIEAREFANGKTIYILSTISKKEDADKSHFKYFIDSFKIKSEK